MTHNTETRDDRMTNCLTDKQLLAEYNRVVERIGAVPFVPTGQNPALDDDRVILRSLVIEIRERGI